MLLVVDTNIIVNAIKSGNKESKSRQLVRDIMIGKHTMCVSTAIMAEYADVLHRPQLQLNTILVDRFLSVITLNSFWNEPQPTNPEQIEMRDEDDRVFFDVAKCLNVPLVTRNYRDYPVHELITLIDELY